MKKRWKAWVLAVCVLIACMPTALAETEEWMYSAETTLFGSSPNKLDNIDLAIAALDGLEIAFGETFSFNEAVGPRSREEGYLSAINGRGARVIGGGVSQVATTLYLAARECGYLSIDPFEVYGERFREWYVEDGGEAVITDYQAGKDFSFTSWYDGTIYISAWRDDDYLSCTLELIGGMNDEDNLIAEAYTPLYGSENKLHNISVASEMIDGFQLTFGEEFSFNEIVGPRSADAGYLKALNGRGAKVTGGGVAQVASTIYLAVKELDCVELKKIRTYGENFVDGYVDDPADAVVTDYKAGYDMAFTYWGDGMLTVYVYEDEDELICEIYED